MEFFTEPHIGICTCEQHQEVMVYIMCAKPDYIMAAADGIVIRDNRIIATDYPKIQKKGNILISYCGLNEVREKGQFRYMKDVIKEITDSFPENGTGYELVQTVEKRLWQDLKYSNTDGTIHLFIASLQNSPLSYQKERLLYALEIRKDSVWKQRFINDQSILTAGVHPNLSGSLIIPDAKENAEAYLRDCIEKISQLDSSVRNGIPRVGGTIQCECIY